jgi:hypothetical protein
MLWGGTGALRTVAGGIPRSSLLIGQAHAAPAAGNDLTFMQIGDSHIGFENPPNTDTPGTLQGAVLGHGRRGAGAVVPEAVRFGHGAERPYPSGDAEGRRQHPLPHEPKSAHINMRVPKPLLDAVKERAKGRAIPYTLHPSTHGTRGFRSGKVALMPIGGQIAFS